MESKKQENEQSAQQDPDSESAQKPDKVQADATPVMGSEKFPESSLGCQNGSPPRFSLDQSYQLGQDNRAQEEGKAELRSIKEQVVQQWPGYFGRRRGATESDPQSVKDDSSAEQQNSQSAQQVQAGEKSQLQEIQQEVEDATQGWKKI